MINTLEPGKFCFDKDPNKRPFSNPEEASEVIIALIREGVMSGVAALHTSRATGLFLMRGGKWVDHRDVENYKLEKVEGSINYKIIAPLFEKLVKVKLQAITEVLNFYKGGRSTWAGVEKLLGLIMASDMPTMPMREHLMPGLAGAPQEIMGDIEQMAKEINDQHDAVETLSPPELFSAWIAQDESNPDICQKCAIPHRHDSVGGLGGSFIIDVVEIR